MTESKLARLLEVARESYDVIVVDTSPFFHGPMLATLDRTDELLLVCGLDVPTLKNVRLSMQTLELLSFPAHRIRFVLNRANSKVGMKKKEVEGALDVKIRFEVPSDRAVPLGVNRGQPPVDRRRGLRLRPRVREIAKSLVDAGSRQEEARSSPRWRGREDHGPSRPASEAERKRGREHGRRASGRARRPRYTTAGQHQPAADNGRGRPVRRAEDAIHHAVIAKLGPELFKRETAEDLSERVLHAVTEQLALDRTPLTREERRRIQREITDDVLGYGPLEPLLRDDSVTEIMVNGHDRIFVERDGRLERTDASFVDDAHLLRIIDKIVSQVGRRIDESSPMVDARLPDGSRVNAIIPPLALKGPTLTIRKFSRDPYTMDDLINFGSLNPQAGAVPGRVRAGEAERPHLRRYRHR